MQLMKVINEYVDQEVAEVLKLKEKCEELEKEQEELKFFSKVIGNFNLQNHQTEHFLEVSQNHQPYFQPLDSS